MTSKATNIQRRPIFNCRDFKDSDQNAQISRNSSYRTPAPSGSFSVWRSSIGSMKWALTLSGTPTGYVTRCKVVWWTADRGRRSMAATIRDGC